MDPVLVIKLEEDASSRAAGQAQQAAQAGVGSAPSLSGGADQSRAATPTETAREARERESGEKTAKAVGGLDQIIGKLVGSLFGHPQAGGLLGSLFGQMRAPTVQPATAADILKATPTADFATFGDMMGLPRGTAQKTDLHGIPIVDPATMGETMAAAAKSGGIPTGTPTKGPPKLPPDAKAGEAGGEEAAGAKDTGMPAAGAVAIAGLVYKAIDDGLKTLGNQLRAPGVIAQRLGDVVGTAAHGDNAEAVGKAYTGMVSLADQIPLVGHAMGLVAESAGRVVGAFHDVTMAFIDRGRELSSYSGGLAASYAIGDVKQMMADMKEAQTLDPALSRLNDQQNELSLWLRDALLPLKQFVIEKLGDFLEWAKNKINQIADFWDEWGPTIVKGMNLIGHEIEAVKLLIRILIPPLLLIPDKNHWKDIVFEGMKRVEEDKTDLSTLWENMATDHGERHREQGPVWGPVVPGLNRPIGKR